MNVLITGANGFVGANLVSHMLNEGNEVIALVRPNRNPWRLAHVRERITLDYVDIADPDSVHKIFSQYSPDGIINTAIYGGYHYQTNEDDIFNTNLNGIRILINEAIKSGFDWFINTGSSSEYGMKKTLMKESDIAEPIDSYGISKLAGTLYCQAIARKLSLPIFTLRLFSIYGYLEEPRRLIPYIMASVINKKTMELNSPTPVRDFTFIEDVCDAYSLTISRSQHLPPGEIFNVGTGKSSTISEVVEALSSILKQHTPVTWKYEMGRISDSFSLWAADTVKVKSALSWLPKHNLKDGISKTYDWFVKNWDSYKERYDE